MAFTSSAVPLQLTGCTAGASQLLPYCFTINLQGDILAILDSAGNTVVQYAYDAWGGKKTTTGTMAGTLGYYNPFRYRGYVWDEETWMYYLRSRYYYPELQRFISADPVIGVQGCIVLCNLFHYCKNNPIIFVDPSGKLFGAVAILVTAVAGLASILYADNKIANTPGLTKQEIALSRTYMLQAYLAKNAAESASRLTDFYFGKGATNADTTRANAFKHAVWNAIMARDLGIDFAEAFASAHESNDINDVRSYNPQGTPTTIREASVMDLINNQRGRELTLISSWWVASDETIAKGVINDLNVNAHLYSIITWGVFELPIQ